MNRDIDLQKIQILSEDFHAWFDVGASVWVGGFIGLLILILTVYYNKQFSPDVMLNLVLTFIAAVIVYVVFAIFARMFMNKARNEFLAFIDELLAKVEKGDSLPSVTELRKRFREKTRRE